MKLTRLHVEHFCSIKVIDETFPAPGLLVAGRNEQGKSSIADAIRLAILGEPGRGIALKKEWGALLREGAQKGYVEADGTTDGERWGAKVSLPSGTAKRQGALADGFAPANAVRAVLSPEWFAAAAPDERRDLLFWALRVDMSGNEIARRLVLRGCNDDKIRQIVPLINAKGHAAACALAEENARDARAAWKATTGEAYGSEKAESWTPKQPAAPEGAESSHMLEERLLEEEREIAEFQSVLGGMEAKRVSYEAHAATMNGLQQKAGLAERAKIAHENAAKEAIALRKQIAETEGAVAAATKAKPEPCPSCGSLLVHQHGKLSQFEGEIVPEPEEARRLPDWRNAAALLERAAANHLRDHHAALEAQQTLADLEKAGVEPVTQAAINDVRAEKDAATTRMRALRTRLQERELFEEACVRAQQTAQDAAQAHRDVKEWGAIAEALSPSGIPGEILSEALAPFNGRLRASAQATGWPSVTVTDDMRVLVGTLPYGLQSESAKWRADLVLAEAVAHFSGLKFLMTDRLDVCDVGHRMKALSWIDDLLASGDLEQAIVIGTFRDRPGMPDSWAVRWIERGEMVEEDATERAA